ncbi:cytochrome P450 [Glomus cerebriforme]|uniref:Cytochrome P450 n=1 Tax=Glomus cerebriforme TaxID=658196 RepID=A0A397T959_9GLOM|nr:cytochrome P450 [Glomus cerebriforme]
MSLLSIILAIDWIVIIEVLISLYIARYYFKYYTRQSPLPGPFPLPLIGNLHQIGLNPVKYGKDHHKEFGDMFEIWIGSNRAVFLSNPSLVDQIYNFFPRTTNPNFDIGGLIFNDNPQTWKRNRKFVVQSIMTPRFLRNFTHITQSLFNENEQFWDKNEYHIDFSVWIKFFTTDITLTTVTRKPSYCLTAYLFGEESSDPIKSEDIKRSVKFSNAVKIFFQSLIFQGFVPEVLKNYVPGFYHLNKKYKKNSKWINETMLDIIKNRRNEIENMQNDENIGSNLLDILLTLNTPRDPNGYDENEAPLNDQEICTIVTEVTLAGTDTTGNTFCFTLWQIARNPKVLARFQEEIKTVLGDDITRQINYEDLDKFTYLDAIVKESIRVIALAPFASRVSTKKCVIGGKQWDPKISFYIHNELIQKSPDCWKDPEEFIPERFLKGSNNEIVKNSFMPFGGGMRICPGRHMAMVELKTLLILLYRKYDVELVDKVSKEPKMKFVAVNVCTEMKVIIRPRKDINV